MPLYNKDDIIIVVTICCALLADKEGREPLSAEEDEDEGEAVPNAQAGAAAAKTGGTFRQVGPPLPSSGVCI